MTLSASLVRLSPDTLTTTPRWALPHAFTTEVTTASMRPLYRAQQEVVVERRAPRVGDVVVATQPTPLFRRVLALRGRRLLLGADLSPAPDGWLDITAVVGVVRSPWTPPGALATRALRASVQQGAGLLQAGRLWRARRQAAVAGTAKVRLLDRDSEADRHTFAELREALYPGVPGNELLEPAGFPVLGAFIGDRLAGYETICPVGGGAVRGPLVVARWARGRGLGTRLVTEAVRRAPALCGARCFWDQIHYRNVPSIRCFLNAGFRIIDEPRLTSVFRPDRGELPSVIVYRELP